MRHLIRFLFLLASLASLVPIAAAQRPGEAVFVPRAASPAQHHQNLELVSVLSAGDAPYDGTTFTLLREEPDAFGKVRLRTLAVSGPHARAEFRVAPGRYRIQARNGAVIVDRAVTVPAGRHHTELIELDAGELRLHGVLSRDGAPADQAWFKVYRETIDAYGRPNRVQVAGNGYAAQTAFLLPSGDYVAEARFGDATVDAPVRVNAGEVTTQALDLAAGLLTVRFGRPDDSLISGKALILIERASEHGDTTTAWSEFTRASTDEPMTFVLPQGHYRLSVRDDLATARADVTLLAGQHIERALTLDAATVRLIAHLGDNAAVLPNALFWLLPDGSSTPGSRSADRARGPANHAEFTVPAGRYRAIAQSDAATGEVLLTLEAGDDDQVIVRLAAGRARLHLASKNGRPQQHTWFSIFRVERQHGGERRVRILNTGYYPELEVTLPTGTYLAQAHGQDMSGEERFDVTRGEMTTVAIAPDL